MSPVETLQNALYGNPPLPDHRPDRAGVINAFSDLQNQVTNVLMTGTSIIVLTQTVLNGLTGPFVAGQGATVLTGTNLQKGRYSYSGTAFVRIGDLPETSSITSAAEASASATAAAASAATAATATAEQIAELKSVGKNKVDKTQIRPGKYYSPGANAIVSSTIYRMTGFIPVVPGTNYYISGRENVGAAWAQTAGDNAVMQSVVFTSGYCTCPAGYNFLAVNLTNDGQAVTIYDDTIQVEIGTLQTEYEPYRLVLNSELTSHLVEKDDLFFDYSFNKIDPAACDYVRRYTTSTRVMVNDTGTSLSNGLGDGNGNQGIAATGYIPVTEGTFYIVSGSAFFNEAAPQGGYFAGFGSSPAVSNIAWGAPPSGSGKVFQVPVGLGITHVRVSLFKPSVGNPTLAGVVQMEEGEVATAYQPYSAEQKIKPEKLIGGTSAGGGGSTSLNAAAWYKYVEADENTDLSDRIPLTKSKWLVKDADLNVVMMGTSLLARSTEHVSDHPKAQYRPPLMHSKNFASHVFDKMNWQGQQYRRYDALGAFAETSAFITDHDLAEWDDGGFPLGAETNGSASRHGLTRYSEAANAAVQFTVPIDAWAFRYIYRTDSLGCTKTVTIAGGNGLMQVFDEVSQTWIEANGYAFSTLEAAPVTRSVDVPNALTASGTVPIVLASKGNTTYQKRLKMRCKIAGGIDSRAVSKLVTIARTGGAARFSYWGVEYSPREHMVTVINSARGSHSTRAAGAKGLPRFQDNEVWSFKPDLLLFELAIHNDGAGAAATNYPTGYWGRLVNDYVFKATYELSLKTRGAFFGLSPEIAMFHGTIAYNFGGIAEDGTLIFNTNTDGSMKAMSSLDRFTEAHQWVVDNQPTAVSINTTQRWVDAAFAIFGGLKDATLGSNKIGPTFTNEGSHPNETGNAVWFKPVSGLLNFMR